MKRLESWDQTVYERYLHYVRTYVVQSSYSGHPRHLKSGCCREVACVCRLNCTM